MTRIKVDFFKDTGKWYTSLEYSSVDIPVWDSDKLNNFVRSQPEFTHGMDYIIEAVDMTNITISYRLYKL